MLGTGRAARHATALVRWAVRDPYGTVRTLLYRLEVEFYWRDLQSCTSSDTVGLVTMLVVLREEGFVVMTITGDVECGEVGRYV